MNENKIHKEDNYENCREPCGQIVHLKHNMDMSVRESCQLNVYSWFGFSSLNLIFLGRQLQLPSADLRKNNNKRNKYGIPNIDL